MRSWKNLQIQALYLQRVPSSDQQILLWKSFSGLIMKISGDGKFLGGCYIIELFEGSKMKSFWGYNNDFGFYVF